MEEGEAVKSPTLRPFTPDEIERIVTSIEKNRFLREPFATNALNDVQNVFRSLLGEITEANPLIIDELIEFINKRYKQASIRPGTTVGLRAAMAIMARFAQETLNTHRKSGTLNNVNSGVDQIREVITATKNIKNPSTRIVYKDSTISFRDALNSRSYIVGSTIASLMEMNESANGPRDGIIPEKPKWYDLYAALMKSKMYLFDNLPGYVLRIKLSVFRLYINGVTTYDVCRVLTSSSSNLLCIPSPTKIGIVDVYPTTDGESIEIASDMIRSTVLPLLDSMVVKGIGGIVSLEPEQTRVWASVYERKGPDGTWDIVVDPNKMAVQGIRSENVLPIIDHIGLKLESYTPSYVRVSIPSDLNIPIKGEPTPDKIYAYYDDANDKKMEEFEKRKESGDECKTYKPTKFDKISMYTFANAVGINMEGLIAADVVDSYNSYPNDVNTIYKMFGIEAARAFIANSLISLIRNGGSDVDARHILILTDMMTTRGVITRVTQKSIQSAGSGFWTKASFMESYKTIVNAALAGESEKVGNVATSLLTGQLAKIGTGYSREFQPTIEVDGEEVGAVDYAKRILREQMLSETAGLTQEQIGVLKQNLSVPLQVLEDADEGLKYEETGTVFSRRFVADQGEMKDVMISATDMGETEYMIQLPEKTFAPDELPEIQPSLKPVVPESIAAVTPFARMICKEDKFEMVNDEEEGAGVDKLENSELAKERKDRLNAILNDPISLIPKVKHDMEIPRALLMIIAPPMRIAEEEEDEFTIEYKLLEPRPATKAVKMINISKIRIKKRRKGTFMKISRVSIKMTQI